MRASTRWLIDTSALRPHVPAFAEVLIPRIAAGLVSVCLVTELEIGYSARSNSDFERISRDVLALLNRVIMPVAAEARAREVQRALIASGQHRAVAIPDLIVAAVAEIEGLTVLHHDGDFDLIAAITGQPVEWIVRSPEPAGPDRPDGAGAA
ncbi:MAG: PIN domain nuclease [Pseudonocardiaceae bacterium]